MAEFERPRLSPGPRSSSKALAWPGRGGLSLDLRLPDVTSWIARNGAVEIDRRCLFPWIAVAFGAGILLHFQADGRPALWAPVAAACLCAAGAFGARARLGRLAILIGLTALFAGFAAAALRVRHVDAPILGRTAIIPVAGFIEAVENRLQGDARIVIRVVDMKGIPEAERPRRVRVGVKQSGTLAAGQYVSATMRLLPPPQPAWPGGYDFARDAYFRGIGAVGSLVGAVSFPPPPAVGWELWLTARIDAARNALTQRIAAAVSGASGGVAAALVTGKRGLIDEATNEVLRGAGIYHIVSISGLHMVLAAGTLFWLTRAILCLSAGAALLWPVKKIAALVGMVGGTAYCVFSGAEVATERSLIMTLVMFGAILADRPALSVRNLSVAALIVLAREPEALIGPSFQMSFGAVAALIAVAPALQWRPRERATDVPARIAIWVLRGIVGLAGTTLVATFATAPFSAFHFQSLNPLGLIGNALALPLVSLAVMPAALLGVLAFPFGLDRPVWQLMGFAVAKVLDVSAFVSDFQGATLVVPAIGAGAFSLLAAALILFTLPASALRWLAVLPAGAGLAFAAAPDRSDLYVDREGVGAAIRGAEGRLVIVGRPSGFVIEQWLRADGDGRKADDETLRRGSRCDAVGCVVRRPDGSHIAYVLAPGAFNEDCRRAATVVTRLVAPATCQAALIIDRRTLNAKGAITVRFDNRRAVLRSSRPDGDPPPWAEGARGSVRSASGNLPRPTQPAPQGSRPRGIQESDLSSGAPD